jgi:hypothetical protein
LISKGRRKKTTSRLRQDKGHLAEWLAFAQVLSLGGPPPIPYDHLFGVMRAAFASVTALRTQQILSLEQNHNL